MKQILFLLTLTLAAQAQTNSIIPPTPTLNNAPAPTANGSRSISLTDCIHLALEKNLDLRIQRFNPELSAFALQIAYGGYSPIFNISGQNGYFKSGGGFNQNSTNTLPSSINSTHVVTSDIGGALPWGMSYDLFGNVTENFGTRSSSTGNPISSFDSSAGQVGLSLTQPLLRNFWMNGNRLNVAVAHNRVKYSKQGLRQQLITTVSDVEIAYYELIYAQENFQVQEKSLELAKQLYHENQKRVEVGVLAPLDEKQAQSQMAARRADLIAAQHTLETRENTLKVLITDDYAAWHDITLRPAEPLSASQQSYNLRESWSRGLEARPDLLQIKLDLEKAGIQLKYYRNQVFPQLDVFGTYGYGASGVTTVDFIDAADNFRSGNLPFYTYGLKFSIPLDNRTARNNYKAGKVTVKQAILILKKTEQNVMVQIDEAIKQAQSSFERVQATHEASEFAQAALDAEQKKLENGKSTSFNVLSLQSALTTARSTEIRALADYNLALTALAQSEGCTLERRKIDVTFK